MSKKFYAQIGEDGFVKAVVEVCDDLPMLAQERKVELSSYDISVLGKKIEKGEFVEKQVEDPRDLKLRQLEEKESLSLKDIIDYLKLLHGR